MTSPEAIYISLILIFLTLCYTRSTTGARSSRLAGTNAQGAEEIPYWFPWLGHSLSLLTDPDRFIRETSQQLSTQSIFALRIFNSKWNIVVSRSLAKAVLQQPEDVIDSAPVTWSLLCRAFGADRKQQPKLLTIHKSLQASCSQSTVQDALSKTTTLLIQSQTPNLISFASGMIDQNLWERPSHTRVIDAQIVESDFFALINNFTGYVVLTALLGTDFMAVYPSILEDLQDLDSGMPYLMLGIPRWFPIPAMAKASTARRRLDSNIDSFHRALDKVAAGEQPEEPWRDLTDVSNLIQARNAVYRDYHIPPALKGPLDLHFIWSTLHCTTHLLPWLLTRILSTPSLLPSLLPTLHSELAPFALTSQPPRTLSIAEPPRLDLNVAGLLHSCPTLTACFHECLRLDTSPVAAFRVHKDFAIAEPRKAMFGDEQAPTYLLRAGDFVTIPPALQSQDSSVFDAPRVFRPARFLGASEKGEGREMAKLDDLTSWSDGEVTGLGKEVRERVVLAFAAGLLALWDFEPVGLGSWVLPGHRASPNFVEPDCDVRVRVRRRVLG